MRAAVRTAGVCHVCGCTDARGCGPTGCGWTDATHTLCTACAAPRCARCDTYAIDVVGVDGARFVRAMLWNHAHGPVQKMGAGAPYLGTIEGRPAGPSAILTWVCPTCRPDGKAVRT